MKTTAEMIEVMQAYEDGKTIEWRFLALEDGVEDKWLSGLMRPKWRWGTCEYRIKPEPLECWVVFRGDGIPCVTRSAQNDAMAWATNNAEGDNTYRIVKMQEAPK